MADQVTVKEMAEILGRIFNGQRLMLELQRSARCNPKPVKPLKLRLELNLVDQRRRTAGQRLQGRAMRGSGSSASTDSPIGPTTLGVGLPAPAVTS